MEWKLLGSINAYTQLLYGSPFSEFKCCSIKELNSVRICIERGLERGLSSLLLQKIFLWKNTEFRSKKCHVSVLSGRCYITPCPFLWPELPNQTILTWRDASWYLQRKEVLQGGS